MPSTRTRITLALVGLLLLVLGVEAWRVLAPTDILKTGPQRVDEGLGRAMTVANRAQPPPEPLFRNHRMTVWSGFMGLRDGEAREARKEGFTWQRSGTPRGPPTGSPK